MRGGGWFVWSQAAVEGKALREAARDSHSCGMWSNWVGALSPLPSLAFFLLEIPHLT